MSFEIKYFYHPKKEDGGYDTEKTEEKVVKLGKPFDDTSLDKVAAAIMSQMARRDIFVVDVIVSELVKKEINFKECKDGKGIILKGKKFSFNESSGQFVVEEECREIVPQEENIKENSQNLDYLYANPNATVPVKKRELTGINQNKVLYHVYFDPEIRLIPEIKRLGLRLTKDKKYPVHKIIEDPSGNLLGQKLVITDDSGKVVQASEVYFTVAGGDLLWDKELNFSEPRGEENKKPKLSFENQMFDGEIGRKGNGIYEGIPLDDGSLPDEYLVVTDIRRK